MKIESLLGSELPIIQAPMAGAQDSALAIAASKAGALGFLPCAMLNADAIRAEVTAIRAATDRPFGLAFFSHTPPTPSQEREAAWREALAPYYREYAIDPSTIPTVPGRLPFSSETCAVVEAFRPAVVSFHFGLPSDELLDRVRRTGARILSSATTVEEARFLESRGVDAIIAQGAEAGGHRGVFLTDDLSTQLSTMALVPQIVNAAKVPVIAAGGIADAAGVAAARALGASAVQVGTAFLLCHEAKTSPVHRAAIEERRRGAHCAHQPVHRTAGARYRQSHHARDRAHGTRAGVSTGGVGHRAFACTRRSSGPRRFLALVVRPERERVPRGARSANRARACERIVVMTDTVEPLILDLLEWIGPEARPYAEVMEAWRTSCPRLPVWEEASARGFVTREHRPGVGAFIAVSRDGRAHLAQHRGTSIPRTEATS